MTLLSVFNTVIGILFTACYFYQYIFVLLSLFLKPKRFPETEKLHRFAILISARNEETVLAELCKSIRAQDYPADLITVHVVADNCTDRTAEIAAANGATVHIRNDLSRIGKGYALDFLLTEIESAEGLSHYDGYIVLDADNLLTPTYVSEMNKAFSAGHRIVTSYRNSKNYGDNWISSGYSLWFLREARQLNAIRHRLGTSCAVSGTGFLVHRDIIKENGGWKHFLLTEDIEFTADRMTRGEKIAYCHDAVFFDEQPVTFSQSWRQRKRWAKGFLQVMRFYGGKLLCGVFRGNFSCFDMLMTLSPAFILSATALLVNVGAAIYAAVALPSALLPILLGLLQMVATVYGTVFTVGLLTLILEWKRIKASFAKKILSAVTLPFFIMTYLPISLAALFTRVEWKPIEHTKAISAEELMKK